MEDVYTISTQWLRNYYMLLLDILLWLSRGWTERRNIDYSPTRSRSIENVVVAVVVLYYIGVGNQVVGKLNTAASFFCGFLAIGLLYGNLDVLFGSFRLSF